MKDAKPWIGMPTRYDEDRNRYVFIRHYADAIEWAGGVPLLIPVMASGELVASYAERLDGVLLPGSPTDIDPARYGRPPHARLGRVFAERDRTDFALLDAAEARHLPVLGICYGAQSLNVSRGGALVQDIGSEVPDVLPHEGELQPGVLRSHAVALDDGSLLLRLAGASDAEVNSDHHQSVEHPGKGLRVVATASDGVVEAVEEGQDRFVVGVQWHPETGWRTDAFARALFTAFVEAAVERRGCGP